MDEIRRSFSRETENARNMFGAEFQPHLERRRLPLSVVNIATVKEEQLPSVTSASVATAGGHLASPKELAASRC